VAAGGYRARDGWFVSGPAGARKLLLARSQPVQA